MKDQSVISTSFIQDSKHVTKSDRFKVITPAAIAQVFADQGLELARLKTGLARKIDNQNHQRTIARYRSKQDIGIDGVNFDIVVDIPHLSGAGKLYLALFRQVCSNGLVAQVGQFLNVRIPHVGNDMEQNLHAGLMQLVGMRQDLVSLVERMQGTKLDAQGMASFAESMAKHRLVDTQDTVTKIYSEDLLRPRRDIDQKDDLFTVLNVVQENMMRYGIRYHAERVVRPANESLGIPAEIKSFDLKTRPINDSSVKAIDANLAIWNEARALLAA